MSDRVIRAGFCVLLALVAWLGVGAQAALAAGERTLPVPTVTIYPGDTIQDGALIDRAFSLAYLGRLPVIDGRSMIVGKVARRTLLPGHPIPVNAVEDAAVINRGVPVQMVFQHGGLTITATAAPLQSGGVGDVIRVRNVDSGVVVVGVVQADGTIRVGTP
jgi:flagella basal body P-ring formation protein FlgA